MLSSSYHPHHFYDTHPHSSSPSPSPSAQHLGASSSSSYATPLYHPTPAPLSPSKRLKVQRNLEFTTEIPSTFDCPPLLYSTASAMPALSRQRLAPHINLQRASEPASPVTISTVSSHSTPSPSPSRVTILSENSPHDFQLFDESFQLNEQQPKHHIARRVPAPFKQQTSNPAQSNGRFSGNYIDPEASWAHWNQDSQMQQPQFYQNGYGNNQEQLALARAQARAMLHHRSRADDDEPPALSPSRGTVSTSSRPSISEHDTPPTPVRAEACYPVASIQHNQNIPKLARTVSDAVQDELFNPGFAPGTTHVASDHSAELHSSQFPQLFQQAQSQHAMSRARTQGEMNQSSPRATTFLPVGGYPTARARREREMEQEAEALKAQMQKEYEAMQQDPKTISPKDAYIEYHEPEGNGVHESLFPSSQHDDVTSQQSDAMSPNGSFHGSIHDDDDIKTEQSYGSMATSRRESDVAMNYNIPMCYVANGQQYPQHLSVPPYNWAGEHSSQESSDPISRDSDYDYDSSKSPLFQRPEDTFANSGAYSCTVHGCPLRFPTASKMSKHRREAHRHGTPLDRNATVRSQHQGPHKCTRINPTTGKPCNTIFSRPYDLTRHEDTIHNTARQKVRCEICNDEKTFSRYDALTRHKKVKHGIDK
jgi:hypothetical protein